MRILVVHPGPNFSVADVHDGWVEALRGPSDAKWNRLTLMTASSFTGTR